MFEKGVYLKTYGCQMNSYDSDRIIENLKPNYVPVEKPENADLVILNTCHIREKASEKLYSDLGRLSLVKEKNTNLKLVVAGCVAQAEGREIQRRQPKVDIVIGPQMYHLLPKFLSKINEKVSKKIISIEFPEESKFDKMSAVRTIAPCSSFLSVQEGCDKFCSFCVVPYTRGSEYSRPAKDIYKEAEILSQKGTKEIILLGQNVNAYHGVGPNGKSVTLAYLIEYLENIDGIERIGYTTSHPNEMTKDLISLYGNSQKLNSYLHLPVQSGSNKILTNMNRKYSVAQYIDIIRKIRNVRADIAISSDFIVGFPGETNDDFNQTLDLVREIGYAQAYSFSYSKRLGTKAAKLKDQISFLEQKKRLLELQELLNSQQKSFNENFIGKKINVLINRKGKKSGQLIGTTKWMQSVHLDLDNNYLGSLLDVQILTAGPKSLRGKIEEKK